VGGSLGDYPPIIGMCRFLASLGPVVETQQGQTVPKTIHGKTVISQSLSIFAPTRISMKPRTAKINMFFQFGTVPSLSMSRWHKHNRQNPDLTKRLTPQLIPLPNHVRRSLTRPRAGVKGSSNKTCVASRMLARKEWARLI
jgi:hypothetical protein